MPATTRGSINRETDSDTATTIDKNKMSEKKKELKLDDIFGEIRRGNKKTEETISGLEKKIDANQLAISNYMKKNDDIVKGLKNKIDTIKSRLTVAEATVKDLEEKVTTLSDDLENTRKASDDQQKTLKKLETNEFERQAEVKRANIPIDGIPEETNGPLASTIKQLLVDIGVTPQEGQILTAFRIGTVNKNNNRRPRTILVKLSSPTFKYEIYKHVKHLKDNETWKKIYISDDLPREVAEQQKILRTLAAAARDRGNRATVRGGALIIDEIRYNYSEIDDLPEGITMENAKMVQLDDGIAFQSYFAYLL